MTLIAHHHSMNLWEPRRATSLKEARSGVFNDDADVLDLVGDVVMTNAAGYTFTADRTRLFLDENRVEGVTPLSGYGPLGEVKSDSYEVLDDGNRIVLKGHVSTNFKPKKRDGAGGGR